ncbi:MarR family winged helix-turn-helix transcriptional regulator [Nocardia sp. NPDC051750]|uniref:MarR family winged helix-turn-helix transcriptional regulator n=1 Tax=Nocardia sp. NPDC051750 TaxID=3364325 RepID=UPI00378F3EEB
MRDTPDPTQPADGGPALFRLVRFWSRRWSGRIFDPHTTQPADAGRVQHIQVLEAVSAALRSRDQATVTDVATQLGIDHSGASRMVRDATTAGYLIRTTSSHDRRRAVLHLTKSGDRLLATSHAWQRECFDQLTATWPPHDRHQFATYLQRLADETAT